MNQIINPYIAGSPVTGPEMFFGRQDVFDFISQTLTGKHRDQVIVLYGRRRTGKTSVLYQMRRHLSDRYLCIFIDLHGLALDGLDGFLWELTNHIRRSLRREYQIEIPRPDKSEFLNDPRGQFEEYFLNQLWAETGEHHVLLMLDEAVRLQEQVQAGKLELDIFEYLRHLMQHYERLNFLFSLGSGLEEMEKQYALLFNVALYKRISFLERDAAVALIKEPVQEYYEVAPAAVEHILDITSGHPYYTQLICHSVFNHWLGSGTRLIGVEDVDETLDEVVERGLAVLKYVWEESTPAEKAVLAAMAAAMGEDKGAATLDDVMAAWSALEVTIPRGEAVKAVRSLTARDVITGDKAYEFRVDLLHKWLLKYERLDWVREEIAGNIEEWQRIATAVRPKTRSNIPRWAAVPLLLTAAIVFLLLGVSLSPTIRDALPILTFVVPTEISLPTAVSSIAAAEMTREAIIDQAQTRSDSAPTDEPLSTENDVDAGGEESDSLEGDALSNKSVKTILNQEGRYFQDFNDYDVIHHHYENAFIGKIGDEFALILEGGGYANAGINEVYEDSYELSYDLFIDTYLSSWNRHELDLFMPNDALRYEFIFDEALAFEQNMENTHNSIVSSVPHTLRPGWNEIRVVVDRERSLFRLYTNESLVFSIDDLPIERTFKILIESWSYVDSAIDNFQIQPGVTSNSEETIITAPAGSEERIGDDQNVYYFNDFNDYNPGGFEISDGVIGEVNGEVAVIMQGQSDRDMSSLPFGVQLGGLDLESYELHYDLYLDSDPSDENGVAINLLMPDDNLRYKFFFRDDLNLQTWINNVLTDRHHESFHNLHEGWNDIRVVVDKDSQIVALYTNGEHNMKVDDVGVENTASIDFETHSVELSAVDNVLLQTIQGGEVSQVGTRVHLLDDIEMVHVPAGSFMMGSDRGEENEAPIHEVVLSDFWIDRTEVTNEQYNLCVDDGVCEPAFFADHPTYNGEDYPVVGVSWDDADAYCKWRGVRLPTEAEWEYAARGVEAFPYPWGNENPNCDLVQFNDCEGNTIPAGSLPTGASWVGALDMAGNAWEWINDWYDAGYYASSPEENPQGPESGGLKVQRGGSWYSNESSLSSTYRKAVDPGIRLPYFGFRCASTSGSTPPSPTGGSGTFVDSGQELGDSDSHVVAMGDLDGDSDLDAIVGNFGTNFVWFNDGTGELFDSGQRLGRGNCRAVSLGDFDSDGDLDAFITYEDQEDLILLNDGGGYFADSEQKLDSAISRAVATGDLDGDGDLDALVGHASANSVWLNDGAGNFNESSQSLGGYSTWAVALADVDGDGDLDAFFGNFGPNELWFNDGAGSFKNSNQSMGSLESQDVAIGDLDGDGDFDAFIANHLYQSNLVWFNDGNGRFSDSGQRLGASDSVDMALGDVDGDGDLDAFVANNMGQANKVWLNDGKGVFFDSGQDLGGYMSDGLALGDLDGDHDLDAYEANNAGQPDRVWINQD